MEDKEEEESQLSVSEEMVVSKTHSLHYKSQWLQLFETGSVPKVTTYILGEKELSL